MGRETVPGVAKIVLNFSCPQCSTPLPDYAPTCKSCGLDLITNETRTPEQLAKSVNRKEQSVFFYISPVKFMVMSFATCGLYALVWFYKNWAYAAEHTNRKLLPPIIGTIFQVLTYNALLKEIAAAGLAHEGVECKLPRLGLALGFFALCMCGRGDGFILLIGMLAPLMLLPTQLYINKLNVNSPTPINDKFTVLNWVFMVIGGSLTLLGLASIFFKI